MPDDIANQIARAREFAEESAVAATKKVRSGARKATKGARAAKENASAGIETARLQAGRAVNTANRLITEHPVAATAAAVAVGVTLAWLFPKSSRKIKSEAPKWLDTVTRTVAGAQMAALAVLPVEEMTKPLAGVADSVGDAARKAPKAALDTARSGVVSLRNAASDALERSGLTDQTSTLIERAGESAHKVIDQVRNAAASYKK
ncbi:MAG: hypothetical protein ABI395_10305 [Sphingobium sp.]